MNPKRMMTVYSLLNIPPHTGCRNCGACCGIIPATPMEVREIEKWLQAHPGIARAADSRENKTVCPFLTEAKRCAIYLVRPTICRLQGVTMGMDCRHGNSANIRGEPLLLGATIDNTVILNFRDWSV